MASTSAVLTNLTISAPSKTLAQRIEHWALDDDDNILFEELSEAAKIWKDGAGYRWHSKSTLSRQDRALHDYRRLISLFLKKEKVEGLDMLFSKGEESNDKLVFPADDKQLIRYIG